MSGTSAAFAERFLVFPDLVPARASGEVWGPEQVRIHFPGGPYDLRGLTPTQARALADRFGSMSGPTDGPGAPVEIFSFHAAPCDFLEWPVVGREYTFDLDAAERTVRLAGPRWMALLGLEERPVGGLWIPDERMDRFPMVVENLLRVFAAYRTFRGGGAVFHSSCVAVDGFAHLFLGRSGAGKSTIAGLCEREGGELLSDDMNAVFLRDGEIWAEGLPFSGELAGDPGRETRPSRSFPLAAVYRLVKGEKASRTPIRASSMAAQMFVCASFVNGDPVRRDALLARFEDLLTRMPTFELIFPRSGPIAGSLWSKAVQ